MTDELIIGCEKFLHFARCIYNIFCQFTESAARRNCAQLVSKKCLEEEIFVGTNFCKLAFDRENCEVSASRKFPAIWYHFNGNGLHWVNFKGKNCIGDVPQHLTEMDKHADNSCN